jgi:hypothetical protein
VKQTHPDFDFEETSELSATVGVRSVFVVVQQLALARILSFVLGDVLPALSIASPKEPESDGGSVKPPKPDEAPARSSKKRKHGRSVVSTSVRANVYMESACLLFVDDAECIGRGVPSSDVDEDSLEVLGQFTINDMRVSFEQRVLVDADAKSFPRIDAEMFDKRFETMAATVSISDAAFSHNIGDMDSRLFEYRNVVSIVPPADAEAAPKHISVPVAVGVLGVDKSFSVRPTALHDDSAMIRLSFSQNAGPLSHDNLSADMDVWIRTNAMKVVFVNSDVQYFIAHLTRGPLLRALASGPSAEEKVGHESKGTPDSVQSSPTQAQQKSPKPSMKVDIVVLAPEVVAPRNSRSREQVRFSFGVLSVKSPGPTSETLDPVERYAISVTDIRADTFHVAKAGSSGVESDSESDSDSETRPMQSLSLLRKVSLTLNASMVRDPDSQDERATSGDIEAVLAVSNIDVVVSPPQIELVMALLAENVQQGIPAGRTADTTPSAEPKATELEHVAAPQKLRHLTLHATAELRSVRISLATSSELSATDSEIARFELTNFRANVSQFANGDMEAGANLAGITISDQRTRSGNAFRQLIAHAVAADGETLSLFDVRLVKVAALSLHDRHRGQALQSSRDLRDPRDSREGDSHSKSAAQPTAQVDPDSAMFPHMSVVAEVNSPRIFVIPDLLRDISASVAASMAALSSSSTPQPEREEESAVSSPKGRTATSLSSLSTMDVSFRLARSQMVLLDDAGDKSRFVFWWEGCFVRSAALSFDANLDHILVWELFLNLT